MLTIVRDFILACSTILATFVIISTLIGGIPFILNLCVTYRGAKRLYPSSINDTLAYGYIIQALTLAISLIGLFLSYKSFMFKRKRIVDIGIKLEKLQIVGVILLNVFLIMIAFCGNEYFGNALGKFKKCSDHFNEKPFNGTSELNRQCIIICGEDFIKEGFNTCDTDIASVEEASPKILLIIICIIFMIGLSVLAYYNTRAVVNYRRALELY